MRELAWRCGARAEPRCLTPFFTSSFTPYFTTFFTPLVSN